MISFRAIQAYFPATPENFRTTKNNRLDLIILAFY
jgi:hypothetical protein